MLRQDNGELQEDVVASDALEGPAGDAAAEVERESAESFPASDAPSHWAGGGPACEGGDAPPASGADRGSGRREAQRVDLGRVVERRPLGDVPERPDPGAPVPGTLPRE